MTTKHRKGRPEAQTVREWLYEFTVNKPVWPAAWGEPEEGYITTPDDFEPDFETTPKASPGGKYTWVTI